MPTEFSIESATVVDIAAAVANATISATEVADAVLARIESVEGKVQAFSQIDPELVRSQGVELDRRFRPGANGSLHGVPVAVKEWFDVEGFPTLMYGPRTHPAPADSGVVARLRNAGAIIVGKTHAPIDGVPPPTRNPWNLEHTAGGSSSGSAAAVAARMVPLAVGEQTTGSNLRPAAFCGLAALKPSYGAMSRRGMFPGAWSRDHPGLMGLTMADLSLVLSEVSGLDPADTSVTTALDPPWDEHRFERRPPAIGVVRNFFPELTEPVMQEAVERAALKFDAAGAAVSDISLPEDFGVIWDALELGRAETAVALAESWTTTGPVDVGKLAASGSASNRGLRREAELIPATFYIQARRIRHWLALLLTQMHADLKIDALLMAAAPGPAPAGLNTTGSQILASPWSYLGFPAISVNAGLAPGNLPLGLQLVAPWKTDFSLLLVGKWCEGVLGVPPPPRVP